VARVPCVCQNCSHLYLHAFTNKWDLAAHPESYAVVLSSALKALQGWVGCQHHLGTCPSTVLKILHHGDVSAPAVNQINMPFLTEWTWQSSNMGDFPAGTQWLWGITGKFLCQAMPKSMQDSVQDSVQAFLCSVIQVGKANLSRENDGVIPTFGGGPYLAQLA